MIYDPDVVCLQETKAEENQVILPEEIMNPNIHIAFGKAHKEQHKGRV